MEAGKSSKLKALSNFDRIQIVMAWQLGQSIFKTAGLVGRSWSAAVHTCQKCSKKKKKQWQSHGPLRLIGAHGESRLALVVHSHKRAIVALILYTERSRVVVQNSPRLWHPGWVWMEGWTKEQPWESIGKGVGMVEVWQVQGARLWRSLKVSSSIL